MADKLTPEQRHRCMSHVRSKNTKPEIIVRKYLFSCGFRYRVNVKTLPGTPDIVLRKYRTVIFVNGCFWHGHEGCKYFVLPKSNVEYWRKKIERNRERDLEERVRLRDMGWHVIQLWECQLKPKVRRRTLEGLAYTLNKMTLLNFGAKVYGLPEAEDGLCAAEDNAQYGTSVRQEIKDGACPCD